MSSRLWKSLAVATVLMLPACAAHAQNHQELSAIVNGPWHHVPDARTKLDFNREMAKCRVISAQTPVDSTTPAVVEIVRMRVLINCLKAAGYEPGNAQKRVATPARRAATALPSKLGELQSAGGGVGIYPCAEFTKHREEPDVAALFFTWAQGFLTGWNMGVPDDSGLAVEVAALSRDDQKQFIREFCDANPTKRYVEGVTALMSSLRRAAR